MDETDPPPVQNAPEAFSGPENVVPLYETLAEAGGPPDECGVTLGIQGDDLDPDEITRLLGVPPTFSHRRGERLKPQSRAPFRHGAWFLEQRGRAPLQPDELTKALLDQLPTAPQCWRSIRERFEIRLVYGVHFSGWNKGFDLPGVLVARIAAIGATMGFDLYAYGEEDGPL
jgi:hypothetical protein